MLGTFVAVLEISEMNGARTVPEHPIKIIKHRDILLSECHGLCCLLMPPQPPVMKA